MTSKTNTNKTAKTTARKPAAKKVATKKAPAKAPAKSVASKGDTVPMASVIETIASKVDRAPHSVGMNTRKYVRENQVELAKVWPGLAKRFKEGGAYPDLPTATATDLVKKVVATMPPRASKPKAAAKKSPAKAAKMNKVTKDSESPILSGANAAKALSALVG